MTKEEIRDAFKPQVVATRQELDIRMNELSLNRNAMMKPLQERLDALNKKKLNLRIEMAAVRIQLDTMKQEVTELERTIPADTLRLAEVEPVRRRRQ